MGGGDLNLKKSWHPTTMKNMERVWKAEQKHEAEQKKIEELQKELAEERAREEIRHFAEDQGVVKKKSERLDWMYEGVSALANKEEYLLGRAVDKTFEVIQQVESGLGNKPEDDALPESIFKSTAGNVTVDLANKIREDPLLMIKKQEDENRKKLLDNPIRMKQIADMLKGMHSSKKSKKEKKHSKKKRSKRHSSNKKDNSDDSSEDERRHRERKSRNGHHKSSHVSTHKSEHSRLPDTESSTRERISGHSLQRKTKEHDHPHVKKEYSNSTLKNETKRKSSKSKRRHDSSDSSSESDSKRRRREKHRSESTDNSDEDERSHKKMDHRHKAMKERRYQKSPSEKDHRKQTRAFDSSIKRERQTSPRRQPVRREKRSSSSESNSSSNHSKDGNDLTSHHHSMISSRKQYGLIVRGSTKNGRKSRSRSPVKICETVTRSSSTDHRHHKNSRHLDSQMKAPLDKQSYRPEKSSKKLDESEKQKRLQEMMENAKERDIQRSANLKQHLEEEKHEALMQMKTAGTDFITPILNKVADVGTVAERIKSNIYNIQRTKADLNKNFAKR